MIVSSFKDIQPKIVPEIKLGLVDRAISELALISRTFQGTSDTSTSELKDELTLTGPDLQKTAKDNFRATVLTLLTADGLLAIESAQDAEALLVKIYFSVNSGLLQEGRPIFRSWETPFQHTPVISLQEAAKVFYSDFADKFNNRSHDPIRFAAWLEQRLNGQIHLYSDGCGRVSRVLSCFALIESDIPYPSFKSREEFFSEINRPFESWLEFYRSRIQPSP